MNHEVDSKGSGMDIEMSSRLDVLVAMATSDNERVLRGVLFLMFLVPCIFISYTNVFTLSLLFRMQPWESVEEL